MGRQTMARQPDPQRRVLRPRNRNLDIAESTTVKRRNARLLKDKLSDLPTNTTDHDDGIYTPEFHEIELWEDKFFKVKIPGTVKIRQKVAMLMKRNGGSIPRPWKTTLQPIIEPHLRQFSQNMKAKGDEFLHHFFELWKMEDVWTFPVDNSFAALFHTQIEQMCRMLPPSILCTCCARMCSNKSTGVRDDGRRMRWCGLCRISSQPELNACDRAGILKQIMRSPYRICAAPG